MSPRKHKLASRLLSAAFVISVFVLFITVSFTYNQMNNFTESEKWVLQSHSIQLELRKLQSYLYESELNQKDLLLSGNNKFIVPINTAILKAKNSQKSLSKLITDSENQEKLKSLKNLITLSIIELNLAIQSYGESDSNKTILNLHTKKGNQYSSQIKVAINDLVASEIKLLRTRENSHARYVKLSPLFYLITAFFAFIIFILAYTMLYSDMQNINQAYNQIMITSNSFEHSEGIAEIGHWVWNKCKNELSFSDNQYKLWGYETNEVKPTFEALLERIHPDDRNIWLESKDKIDTGNSPIVTYFRVVNGHGKIRHFKAYRKNIQDHYDQHIMIGINVDITDQFHRDKLMEEQLIVLENNNKELSAFTHIASHDLQEPLRKIQTLISRIEENDFPDLSEKGREQFTRIVVAATRMQKLITDLLAYSKVSRISKEFTKTDLQSVLDQSLLDLEQKIDESNARIISDKLPTLKIIPHQIQQVFTNIISNSIKYHQDNTPPIIEISSELFEKSNSKNNTLQRKTKYYIIRIKDNGIGFKQEYSEKIFTIFNRLHDNSKYAGTGIGLAICKKIIEHHKGSITAISQPGLGSTIEIILPINNS